MPSLNDSIEVTSDFVSTEVDGESILLHVSSGTYYGLNELGTRILDRIEEDGDVQVEHLVDDLNADFPDVDYERLADDVLAFINEMEEYGLFVVHENHSSRTIRRDR